MKDVTFRKLLYAAVLFLAAGPVRATTILGGLEDTPGSSGYEKDGDFNDMIFQVTGHIAINAPGAVFNNLIPGVVNENGTIFWDQHSLDGPDENVGYCLLGTGNCAVAGAPFQPFFYVASPTGGAVNNITFSSTGTLTIQMLGEFAALAGSNTLGWYDPAHPGTLHQIFSGPDTTGATVTFTPTSTFAFYSTNGEGQLYASMSGSNLEESEGQEHFAFFTTSTKLAVPEPTTGVLATFGLVLVGLGSLRAKLAAKRRTL
jgi:hypothetical protein